MLTITNCKKNTIGLYLGCLGYLSCPFSGRDNVSPDSTTADNSNGETTVTASGIGPGSSRQTAGSSTEQPDQQPMQV